MKEENIYIPPSRDIAGKNLFGTQANIEFTASMLKKLLNLPEEKVKGMVISNSIKLDKETVENKHFEMDILVRFQDGDEMNLELQSKYDEDSEIKHCMYITGTFYKNIKSGQTYKEAHKVTGLTLAKELKMHNKNKLIQKYYLTNEEDIKDKLLPELFEIIIVNLDHSCEYLEDGSPNEFEGWRKFLCSETKEELYEVSKDDEILQRAYKEHMRFMNLDYVQNFEADEKLRRSREIRAIDNAKLEGKLEGKIEGKQEGKFEQKLEIAKAMLENNESIEKIMAYTNLSKEEIKAIILF